MFSFAFIYWEFENWLRSHESLCTNKGKKWVTYQINFICLHSALVRDYTAETASAEVEETPISDMALSLMKYQAC